MLRMLRAGLILVALPLAASTPEEEVRATFERFVAAQNAHDPAAVAGLLQDAPSFLWITKGTPIWGREAALARFKALYQGTWTLAPDAQGLRVTLLSEGVAQLYAPIRFTIGAPGQPPADTTFLMNMTLVKGPGGWRIASLLPIPVPPPPPKG